MCLCFLAYWTSLYCVKNCSWYNVQFQWLGDSSMKHFSRKCVILKVKKSSKFCLTFENVLGHISKDITCFLPTECRLIALKSATSWNIGHLLGESSLKHFAQKCRFNLHNVLEIFLFIRIYNMINFMSFILKNPQFYHWKWAIYSILF